MASTDAAQVAEAPEAIMYALTADELRSARGDFRVEAAVSSDQET